MKTRNLSLKVFFALICVFLCADTIFAAKKPKAKKVKKSKNDVEKVAENAAEPSSDEKNAEPEKIEKKSSKAVKVVTLNGPTSIPVAYLYENKVDFGNGTEAEFEVCSTVPVELPKLLKGEADIGFLPPNAAAKVFNTSNEALVMLGITGNGMLSLITTDEKINSLADLKGKRIAVAGAGSTPEYIFRYILEKNNLPYGEGADDIKLDFSIPTSEIAASLISGKISCAVVPEPFATVAVTKGDNVRKAISLQEEFAKIEGENATFPMTVMVCRKAFALQNPQLVSKFIEKYKEAVAWTNANPPKAGVLVQKHTLGLLAPIVAKSIPVSNFVFVDSKTAQSSMEKLLSIFNAFAPDAVGGKLPEDGFYF